MIRTLMRRISPTAIMLPTFIVVSLAVSILVGWALGIPTLKGVLPGLVTMKPNTAAGLLLCSASLAGLSYKTSPKSVRIAAILAAVVVVALAATTLSEDLFSWNAGIDQFLIPDSREALIN